MSEEVRIVRSIKELPDWFDINNYLMSVDEINDIALWHDLMVQRRELYGFMNLSSEKEINKILKECSGNIRSNPINPIVNREHLDILGGSLKFYSSKNEFEHFPTIRSLSYRRLYQIENRLKDEVKDKIRKWFDTVFSHDFSSNKLGFLKDAKWANLFIDRSVFDVSEEYTKTDDSGYWSWFRKRDVVEIDFRMPDKILIEQFKDYLKATRASVPSCSYTRYKAPNLEKLYDYKVLAYIDLWMWAQEKSIQIPYRVMADALYSNSDKGEEVVRKTTKNIFSQIFSYDYIDFLGSLAVHDIVEKNLNKTFRKK